MGSRIVTLLMFLIQLSRISATGDDQLPLQYDVTGNRADTFTLRHVFYRALDVANNQIAASVAIPQVTYPDKLENARLASLTMPIRIRFDKTGIASHTDSVQAHEKVGQDGPAIPLITDRDTIVNLAVMSSDVYYFDSSDPGWLNLTQGFNDSRSFGYDRDGLQGHVFANDDNSTIVVAFKGSSINPLDKTRNEDRRNDNLLFSCCCATQRPDPYWYGKVCDCRQSVYKCNSTCLTREYLQEDRYYSVAKSIMHNITHDLYPSAKVLTTGHSLGGSIASLMAHTFKVPAVTFEAPPDRLAARRLGLVPQESSEDNHSTPPVYHFGNTADPVFMGACTGFISTCAVAGYAFESQCFTGKICRYDTMSDKGWHLNILNHRINTVINDVLKAYDQVPECKAEEDDCAECFNWRFD